MSYRQTIPLRINDISFVYTVLVKLSCALRIVPTGKRPTPRQKKDLQQLYITYYNVSRALKPSVSSHLNCNGLAPRHCDLAAGNTSMVSRRSRGWVPYLAVGLIIKLDDQKARMITYTYLTRPRHHFGISLTPPKPSLKAHNDRPISHDVRSGSTKMHSSRI
ncbi:hypothetical protein CVT26_001620 [Gymnopilus dilepis]|uniref:Uncharacterized protein n=1 Tax=Gymnopilus dilepis TaxID=231916 RepID=A0A409VSQ8_9AGAR|nr:hypothetical protein CVT26_001620 [Gymnopilus dilepis]